MLGASVTVLTSQKEPFDSPLDLELPELPNVDVVAVRSRGLLLLVRLLLHLPFIRNYLERIRRRSVSPPINVPDVRKLWRKRAYRAATRIAKDCDVVVSTYGPSASHLIAYDMKTFNKKIFWVADYRDLWSNNRLLGGDNFGPSSSKSEELRTVGASADLVVGVSRQMVMHLERLLGKDVHLNPNGFDPDRAQIFEQELLSPLERKELPFVFGWIGTQITYERYLAPLMGLMRELADLTMGEFWVIGATDARYSSHNVRFKNWSLEAEKELLSQMDLGVMPLDDDDWSRGKCGYKALQYMAHGLPVVVSPVGVNSQIVDHGVDGFLSAGREDWKHNILAVSRMSREERTQMGHRGKLKVRQSYSVATAAPILLGTFNRISQSLEKRKDLAGGTANSWGRSK